MRRPCWLLCVCLAMPAAVAAQSIDQFDGRPLDSWVTALLDDTSNVRRNRLTAALRLAPPAFRQAVTARLNETLNGGSADAKERVLGIFTHLINPGQGRTQADDVPYDLRPAVPTLRAMAMDTADPLRGYAFWLLTRSDPETRASLLEFGRSAIDSDPELREDAIHFVARLGDPADVPRLAAATRDPDADIRSAALEALGRYHARRAVPVLTAGLEDSVPWVRAVAIDAIGRAGPAARAAVPRLLQLIGDTVHYATGTFAETISAEAALALSRIIPRRGGSDTALRIELEDEDGSRIRR